MSRTFVETLESRQLFAAATLSDLTTALKFAPPAVVQPGSNVAPVLTITNTGASIKKSTQVPVRLFISPTPTLAAGAAPFKVIQEHLALPKGQSTTLTLTSTLPTDVTAGTYYLIVQVNNKKSVKESNYKDDVIVSKPLHNPLGTYAGSYKSDDGRSGTLTVRLTSEAASSTASAQLFADFSSTSDGIRVHREHVKCAISSAGVLLINSKGGYNQPGFGHINYSASIHATLNGDVLTGRFHLSVHSTTVNRNATAHVKLTRP